MKKMIFALLVIAAFVPACAPANPAITESSPVEVQCQYQGDRFAGDLKITIVDDDLKIEYIDGDGYWLVEPESWLKNAVVFDPHSSPLTVDFYNCGSGQWYANFPPEYVPEDNMVASIEEYDTPTPGATFDVGTIPYDLCPAPEEHNPNRTGVLKSGSLSYLDNGLNLPHALALEDVPVTILEETDSAVHISTSGAGYCFWWGNQIVWIDTRGWENISDFDHWVEKADVIR